MGIAAGFHPSGNKSGHHGITGSHGVDELSFRRLCHKKAALCIQQHCAPAAHRTLGTYPTGTIRFSFGWWNTEEEVDTALGALEEILKGRRGHGA